MEGEELTAGEVEELEKAGASGVKDDRLSVNGGIGTEREEGNSIWRNDDGEVAEGTKRKDRKVAPYRIDILADGDRIIVGGGVELEPVPVVGLVMRIGVGEEHGTDSVGAIVVESIARDKHIVEDDGMLVGGAMDTHRGGGDIGDGDVDMAGAMATLSECGDGEHQECVAIDGMGKDIEDMLGGGDEVGESVGERGRRTDAPLRDNLLRRGLHEGGPIIHLIGSREIGRERRAGG